MNRFSRRIYILTGFLLPVMLYAQAVRLKASLVDTSASSAKEYLFQISVRNTGFDKYWVQDTMILKGETITPSNFYIYPALEILKNGHYEYYNQGNFSGNLYIEDSCRNVCCNCILLKKGEATNFTMSILNPYNKIIKGKYRLRVSLRMPYRESCKDCDRKYREVWSDYLYFDVTK